MNIEVYELTVYNLCITYPNSFNFLCVELVYYSSLSQRSMVKYGMCNHGSVCFFYGLLIEYFLLRLANYVSLVTAQLYLMAGHMVLIYLIVLMHSAGPYRVLVLVHCGLYYSVTFFVQVRLGLSDTDAWHIIETIAEKNNLGYKQLVC